MSEPQPKGWAQGSHLCVSQRHIPQIQPECAQALPRLLGASSRFSVWMLMNRRESG